MRGRSSIEQHAGRRNPAVVRNARRVATGFTTSILSVVLVVRRDNNMAVPCIVVRP